MSKSFCFVLNPLEVSGILPIEIAPSHWLQKADSEQIKKIKEKLIRDHAHVFPLPAYEYSWIEKRDDKGNHSRESRDIPPEQWRYWVVVYDGPNTQTQNLQLATNLLQNDLDLGLNFVYWNEGKSHGTISNGSTNFSFFESHLPTFGDGILKTTSEELGAVKGYFKIIQSCEKDQPHIYRAVADFFALKSLPRRSSMVVLGYFSLIEAIVTHDPKDDYDSLNHQISTKMTLLSKKFERRLDYDSHFGTVDREKLWKLLYSYRSSLAHGTTVDFKSKLKILRDSPNVLSFLKEATKLTLLFAMNEPEFVSDLKKC